MELHIKNDGFTETRRMMDSKLTCAELGAVATLVFMTRNPANGLANIEARASSPEFLETMKSLKERGVLAVRLEGRTVKISVDLDKA